MFFEKKPISPVLTITGRGKEEKEMGGNAILMPDFAKDNPFN